MDWGYLNPGQLCNLHLPRLFKGLRVIAAALTPLSLTPRPRIATRGARARAGAGLASPPIRSQSPEPRRPGARTWQPITDLSGRACGGGGVGGAWGLRRRSPLGLRLGSALGRCASGRLGTAADGAGKDGGVARPQCSQRGEGRDCAAVAPRATPLLVSLHPSGLCLLLRPPKGVSGKRPPAGPETPSSTPPSPISAGAFRAASPPPPWRAAPPPSLGPAWASWRRGLPWLLIPSPPPARWGLLLN